ncbi:metal ABC transporter solute-binding protein, Zn/Mn family [Ureibacillus chungkukjangi]|uniref:Zinc transport system substrate-binding protein n=1 Tax=Ureibacillus chungkukjangi TaxID=1202712 RepID=A0A318TZI6_9BACL|nr:zinc ABC transporter substrate-binding protein [Ureibacillus chungkukjangi]PYF09127.1 zinc transport system substrate-binding protein [Ureibacillus chungkukjangi]
MKKFSYLLLIAALFLGLTACNSTSTTNNEAATTKKDADTINVYTTVYPLSYFAERIGGEYVNVTSIYPPGTNEHTFEPTQKDMMALADADLFFYIGLGLEGFVENAKNTLKNENVKLVATSDAISDDQLQASAEEEHAHEDEGHEEHDHDHEGDGHEEDEEEGHEGHNHGETDPHLWLSPTLSQDLARAVKDELVAALPEQEQLLNENYDQLISDLESLDQEFEKMASKATSKTFFVSHASFGYIAQQYGLEQIAIAGINSQSEPSQKELTEIVDQAEMLQVSYILFEQNVSSKLSSVIQNEVGADSLELHNLSVLTEEDIKNNEIYFTLMEKNIETLSQALQ